MRNRSIVTFFSYSDNNRINAIKNSNARTLSAYADSLLSAQISIPNLAILVDPFTHEQIRGYSKYDNLKLFRIEAKYLQRDRERFFAHLESGCTSMIRKSQIGNNAESDYLAVTQCKIRYLLDYRNELRKKVDFLMWVDAGIFLPTHKHCHGSEDYKVVTGDSVDLRYAASVSKREILSTSKLKPLLRGETRTQLLGAAFSIRTNLLDEIVSENDRVIDYSIRKLKFIPTEQCSYLVAFSYLGCYPNYLIRNYNCVYRKILSNEVPRKLDLFQGRWYCSALRNEWIQSRNQT